MSQYEMFRIGVDENGCRLQDIDNKYVVYQSVSYSDPLKCN